MDKGNLEFEVPGKREIEESVDRYISSVSSAEMIKTALIDMDGILYDSMPYHTLAWKRMTDEAGIDVPRNDFYLYEGMTGAETLRLIYGKAGKILTDDEIRILYARKTDLFREIGHKDKMPGADMMLSILRENDVRRILVTGSGQKSLVESLETDYPGAFCEDDMVTAADVTYGKPHPEPYIRGLAKADTDPCAAIVVENAPLGVRSGHLAGCFTVAVATGPIPKETLLDNGADIVFPSMTVFAESLPFLLEAFNR